VCIVVGSRKVAEQPQVLRFSALAQNDSKGGESRLLQMLNLGQQLRRLVFKLAAAPGILFRILAGAVLKAQVSQVFVELLLALQQKIQPGLLALACEDVLRQKV